MLFLGFYTVTGQFGAERRNFTMSKLFIVLHVPSAIDVCPYYKTLYIKLVIWDSKQFVHFNIYLLLSDTHPYRKHVLFDTD